MLSRLLTVRLKAAENALRDGRIDEAYRLATAADIREHRRGAAVLAALAERFLERARNHYRADRFTEALIDLDRAETGGVLKEDIAELRDHVRTVAAANQEREAARRGRLNSARRRIEGGSLAAGRRILEQASNGDHAAEALQKQAADRAADVAGIVEQAQRLVDQGRIAAAVKRLERAKAIDAHTDAVIRVETHLCNHVLGSARTALSEGKIARAKDELACLGKLGGALPDRREVADMIAAADRASQCVRRGQFADARRHVLKLNRQLPDARWINEAAEQLRQIEELGTVLCTGPLGDCMSENGDRLMNRIPGSGESAGTATPRDADRSLDETVALPQRASAGSLPDTLLLLVDGGGSYLVLRSQRATIGRATSNRPADVPLISDVAERHASIARVDDDYFLFTDKEVEVGGRRTPHQLLRDGDRIVLGRKAKLTFRLPSLKSPTAVLDLSDTTKMPNDVRRVVLFHRHAGLGPDRTAHIRCQPAGPSLVLFERDDRLWIRQRNDGHVDTEPVRLELGRPIEIAGASLILQPWEIRMPGTRAI